jgi:hypothetical protein
VDTPKQSNWAGAGKIAQSDGKHTDSMSRVIALCQWDSTLSVEDQLFMRRSWESIGTWRKGIRKYPKAGMRREMAFRAKVTKLFISLSQLI